MDMIDIVSVVIIVFSLGVFGRFTYRLIKQHYDIYPLLYGLEEAEKKKKN